MRPGLVSLLMILLSACGQRGPLYLPDEPQPEAVMSTGDQSGETDDQTDWTESGAGPETGGPHAGTEAGDTTGGSDDDEDGKDVEASPAAEPKD